MFNRVFMKLKCYFCAHEAVLWFCSAGSKNFVFGRSAADKHLKRSSFLSWQLRKKKKLHKLHNSTPPADRKKSQSSSSDVCQVFTRTWPLTSCWTTKGLISGGGSKGMGVHSRTMSRDYAGPGAFVWPGWSFPEAGLGPRWCQRQTAPIGSYRASRAADQARPEWEDAFEQNSTETGVGGCRQLSLNLKQKVALLCRFWDVVVNLLPWCSLGRSRWSLNLKLCGGASPLSTHRPSCCKNTPGWKRASTSAALHLGEAFLWSTLHQTPSGRESYSDPRHVCRFYKPVLRGRRSACLQTSFLLFRLISTQLVGRA